MRCIVLIAVILACTASTVLAVDATATKDQAFSVSFLESSGVPRNIKDYGGNTTFFGSNTLGYFMGAVYFDMQDWVDKQALDPTLTLDYAAFYGHATDVPTEGNVLVLGLYDDPINNAWVQGDGDSSVSSEAVTAGEACGAYAAYNTTRWQGIDPATSTMTDQLSFRKAIVGTFEVDPDPNSLLTDPNTTFPGYDWTPTPYATVASTDLTANSWNTLALDAGIIDGYAQGSGEVTLLLTTDSGYWSFWNSTESGMAPQLILRTAGDANGDDVVDDADYTLWADNYLTPNATWAQGDFNLDGTVDDADYTIWADNYLDGAAAAATTPEPATLAVLALGGLWAIRRRR